MKASALPSIAACLAGARAACLAAAFALSVAWQSGAAGSAAAHPDVTVVSGDATAHQEVVTALRERIGPECTTPCRRALRLTFVDETDAARQLASTTPELIVSVGTAAASSVAALQPTAPTLFGFLPREASDQLANRFVDSVAGPPAVVLDQPPARLLRLARLLDPAVQRIGVLVGPASDSQVDGLAAATQAQGLELHVARVTSSDDVGSQLRTLTGKVDLLLALPDPVVYNRNTIYPIMLTTYGARIPVVGFSAAMVRAGAVAAVYMSPRDGGQAIAQAVETFLSARSTPGGATLPDVADPPFSITLNRDVLRSLRLPDTTADVLLERLQESSP